MTMPPASTGRTRSDRRAAERACRRLVGFERHYSCGSCGAQARSWKRLGACPACGDPLWTAVIRRAALAA